jgi:hypothetical protein
MLVDVLAAAVIVPLLAAMGRHEVELAMAHAALTGGLVGKGAHL